MSRWNWTIQQVRKQLWVRVTLWGVVGAFAALLAAGAQFVLPAEPPITIGADAVESILSIIASSMLAVTTFSLSTMLGAYSAASSGVSPRATTLLMEDELSQKVLATFMGSFLFSMVGIVALKTGIYDESGRVVLFYFSVGMIALIVVMLLRWINHLTRLGRLGETTARVEAAALQALQARLDAPWLGCHPASEFIDPPETTTEVTSGRIGYLQYIDLDSLEHIAAEFDATIHLMVLPGSFAFAHTALLRTALLNTLDKEKAESVASRLRQAFVIETDRNFAQDPRFGVMVMCEIATGALTPGHTDSGTAIDIIGRLTRLLSRWGTAKENQGPAHEPRYPHLYAEPLLEEDLFEDAFMQIARDGAGLVEIQVRLQKSLEALAGIGPPAFRTAAREQAQTALSRARDNLTSPYDQARLAHASEWLKQRQPEHDTP